MDWAYDYDPPPTWWRTLLDVATIPLHFAGVVLGAGGILAGLAAIPVATVYVLVEGFDLDLLLAHFTNGKL